MLFETLPKGNFCVLRSHLMSRVVSMGTVKMTESAVRRSTVAENRHAATCRSSAAWRIHYIRELLVRDATLFTKHGDVLTEPLQVSNRKIHALLLSATGQICANFFALSLACFSGGVLNAAQYTKRSLSLWISSSLMDLS